MPKTKTQSHNERPTAASRPHAGRRQVAPSVPARAPRSAAPQPPAGRAKPKGAEVPAATAVVAATPTPQRQPRASSKQAAIITLLHRPDGTDLATLMAATGWQSHSVRAVLSGLRKQGHRLHRDAGPNGSVYRIVQQASDAES